MLRENHRPITPIKLLALALCAALLLPVLASCGGENGGDGGNVTYGRYVEEDISPEGMPGYINSFASFGGGVLDIITVEYGNEANPMPVYRRRRSADGGQSWQVINMDWTLEYYHDYSEYYERNEQPPEQISLNHVLPLEDGSAIAQVDRYLLSTDDEGNYVDSRQMTEFFRVSASGAAEPYEIPEITEAFASGSGGYVNSIRVLPGNRLYLHYNTSPTEEQATDPTFDYMSLERKAVYDLQTRQKLYEVSFNGYEILSNSTTLYLNDYESGLKAVNIADGTPSAAPMPGPELAARLQNSYMGSNSTFVDEGGNFYMLSARGLDKISAQGGGGAPSASTGASGADGTAGPQTDGTERVMEGLNYTYGSPLYNVNGLAYNTDDESLVVAMYESSMESGPTGDVKLMRYVWDDEAIATSDDTLRVYSLYDNYSVRLALSEFKRQRPEVMVQYDTAFTEEDMNASVRPVSVPGGGAGEAGDGTAMTEEDALRALNTELLNGTGPDVLILDGLPIDSFTERGVLEDLSSIAAENSDLLSPVVDGMRAGDGKLYALPTNFFLPALFGEVGYADSITGLDAFVAAVEEGAGPPVYREYNPEWSEEEQAEYYEDMNKPKPPEETPVLYFQSLDEAFDMLYTSSAPAMFTQSGIDGQKLSEFLQAMKAVSDKYNLASPETSDGGGYYVGGGMAIMGSGYARWDVSGTMWRYGERQSRLGYTGLGSLMVLESISSNLHYSADPNRYSYTGKGATAALGGAEGDAEPEPEEEWLPAANPVVMPAPGLSQGVYIPAQIAGVTTTSKRADIARAFVASMLSDEVQKHDMGVGLPVTKTALDNMYADYIEREQYMVEENILMIPVDHGRLIGGLTTPFLANSFLRDTVYSPMLAYCGGGMALEAAVSKITQETEMYFAERQ